ncbi:MAG TPA: TetR/AcrR family transcriptional regulator [Polyangiales bacterium]|jgi:AcrR family transcriptional regulator|nr:TetR/AcrR family transcriptional regulator [Polyangiales bacterium]
MESTSPSDRPARRTQQERRDGTQRALLDATVSALCELGYGGTTTLEVERRARVSRGARIHHFPTKAALLASAVDHLYNQLSDHYEQAFGSPVEGLSDAERFRHGLRLLWSIYRKPDYAAVLELQMAARTDAELREHLRVVGDRHRLLAIAAAHKFFPVLEDERALSLIETVHASMVGMLIQSPLAESVAVGEMILAMLDDLVELHLGKARVSRS